MEYLPSFEDFINESRMSKQQAIDLAIEQSAEGYVVHVNKIGSNQYDVSDWYEAGKTIASYENGKKLNEERIEEDFMEDSQLDFMKKRGWKPVSPNLKKILDANSINSDKAVAVENHGSVVFTYNPRAEIYWITKSGAIHLVKYTSPGEMFNHLQSIPRNISRSYGADYELSNDISRLGGVSSTKISK